MLFLRLSWVVAEAGILWTLIIIAVSSIVCVITTLSLSAISTNGEVKGGGVYFIISRSLGPEFGASVGVVFAFANAVSASMNTIGFCESLNLLLSKYPWGSSLSNRTKLPLNLAESNGLIIVDNGINDIRIVGSVTILVLILICCVGMEWETKAQNFLIFTIILAIINFLIGSAIGPRGDEKQISRGFVGFSCTFSLDKVFQNLFLTFCLNRVHIQRELWLRLSLCRRRQPRLLQRLCHLLSERNWHSGGSQHLWRPKRCRCSHTKGHLLGPTRFDDLLCTVYLVRWRCCSSRCLRLSRGLGERHDCAIGTALHAVRQLQLGPLQLLWDDAGDVALGATHLRRLLCGNAEHGADESAVGAASGPGFGHRSDLSRIDFLLKALWQTWRALSRLCADLLHLHGLSANWRAKSDRPAHFHLLPSLLRAHQLLHIPRGRRQAPGLASHF